MNNLSMNSNNLHLNFKYDKYRSNKEKKGKHLFSVDKINKDKYEKMDIEKKILDLKKDKNKKELEHSYLVPKFNDKKDILRGNRDKNNLNIINNKNDNNIEKKMIEKENNMINIEKENIKKKEFIEKNKEKKEPKEPKDSESSFITSINEIRLPEELYDISYDILQNG